jgi:anti-anti-sigma factor
VSNLLRLERVHDGFFRLIGELDVSIAPAVTERLLTELKLARGLTLDTSGLRFMDSQGLRMLILLGREVSELETTVTVANCSNAVRRLLEVSIPNGIPGVEILEADA